MVRLRYSKRHLLWGCCPNKDGLAEASLPLNTYLGIAPQERQRKVLPLRGTKQALRLEANAVQSQNRISLNGMAARAPGRVPSVGKAN